MATLFAIATTLVIIGWLWFFILRPIAVDFGLIPDAESVNDNEPVMSRSTELQEPLKQTDKQTDLGLSADDPACPRLQLDRTKQAAIEVMVYNGWGAGEIRAVIKGDNGAIGAEVEAARKRLGISSDDSRTPIAGRVTAASFPSDKVAA